MNALKNKVQLIGNLGMNPEIKALEGGRKVAKFTLATNEVYKNQKGEKVQDTQWHNIVAWGKTASLMEELLTKGKEVLIEGKLTNRSWEDRPRMRIGLRTSMTKGATVRNVLKSTLICSPSFLTVMRVYYFIFLLLSS